MGIGIPGAVVRTGSATASNGSADETVIAAPGANKVLRILKGVLSVTIPAVGGLGLVALEDGVNGNVILQAAANSVKEIPFDFGPKGIPLTANTVLNVTVNTAVTTQATAVVSATAYEVG